MCALAEQLAAIVSDLEDTRARLQHVQRRLDDLHERNVLGLAREFENEVKFTMQLLESQARQAAQWQQELDRRLHRFTPATLTILGGLPE